ncbi:6-phosphogluconolactonase [Facilibium subflavum]|uniref:6-phosphogluconolactonase n=1 Tax=Facilibium subflavum TaxID=2219058 RepID=UPI000E653ACE|nr:6-phosphogluconolactonase [Facilibium subflavum]
MHCIVYDDKQQIADVITEKLITLSYAKKPIVHIALSGGSTPKDFFKHLKQADALFDINWSKFHFWWVDERCVSIEDEQSNFGEAKRILFDHIGIDSDQLHPMDGASQAEQSALSYVQIIKKHLPIKNQIPCFDLILLGIGDDGHTASLFPNGVSLSSNKWVEVAEHPQTNQLRLTLTLQVLNNADEVAFVVTGENKAKMVKKIIQGDKTPIDYPAKFVKPLAGKLTWHLDREAAAEIR